MGNEKIRTYYERMAENISDARATRNKAPDSSAFDVAYIQQFADSRHDLLDLGAGTGLLLNRVKDGFRKVVAVELHPNFSKFITPAENTTVINEDLLKFETNERFDLVILFGTMNYFSTREASELYKKFHRFSKPGGKLIVKNQMGIKGDVLVDKFSEELQQNYFSEYRSIESEKSLMEAAGFDVIRMDDIYPDAFNRWPDTRFTAIVAQTSHQTDQ